MKHGLFAELKRRHVYRVAVAYAVVGWLVIQAAATVSPYLHLPDTLTTMVIVVVALGFPIALILTWAFELTPEGVRRTESADSSEAREPEQHRKVGHTLDRVIIGVLVVAVALLAWRVWTPRKASPGPTSMAATTSSRASPASSTPATASSTTPAKSIAVLPFENLSTDKANAYFADGMQDLILTKLASIGDLAVISRTSTMKYGSHPQNLQTVGKQLGVATILEGSVQKVGDQVLVNVQLIDARNDHHIWADSYTRTLKNVFSVEGEVAQKIATRLKAKLSPAETRRLATTLSDDPAANDLYLQGEYFSHRGSVNYDTAAMKQAIGFYRQAIAREPDFAQARARLSINESELAWNGGGGTGTATLYADALAQAEQALKLAPDLADAQLALGFYDYWGRGDYPAALKAFSAAQTLRPNDIDALWGKAYVLRRQGKFHQAMGMFDKALALDPRNTSLVAERAGTLMAMGQYERAQQSFQRALALDPANATARAFSALAMVLQNGDLTGALAKAQGDNSRVRIFRVYFLIWARKYDQALEMLHVMPDSPDTFNAAYVGPKALYVAYLHELRGDPARARVFYARALSQARAQYASLSGSPPINQALSLIRVAQAELGLGRTRAGLADTDRALAMGEHSRDRYNLPQLMVLCAQRYAQAGRADKAVPVLSAALASPGVGSYFSPVQLWLEPAWDPIRKTPAFQALEKKYAKYRPATLPSSAKG